MFYPPPSLGTYGAGSGIPLSRCACSTTEDWRTSLFVQKKIARFLNRAEVVSIVLLYHCFILPSFLRSHFPSCHSVVIP